MNNGTTGGVSNYSTWGDDWATTTNSFADYMAGNANEYAGAADDAEPGFDPAFTTTNAELNAYNGESVGWLMYDYGSMDGDCETADTYSSTVCDSGTWTGLQHYMVAYGYADDYPAPEIYSGGGDNPITLSYEWTNLVYWSEINQSSDEIAIDVVTANPDTAEQANYNDLESVLNGCGCGDSQNEFPIQYETYVADSG